MSEDFKPDHLRANAPTKYRRLYESALRAHGEGASRREVKP
jgi:hypothetical protein